MNQLPDFWRTEVFHPLSVHFPIALLLIATAFIALSFISKKLHWVHSGSILLFLGSLSAWISIYTGDLADGIVSRQICDPTVLKDHENFAYYTAWVFSAASLIDLSKYFLELFKKPIFRVFVLIAALVGCYCLVQTGHKGANVVYQQAGGVYVPSNDCSEFE